MKMFLFNRKQKVKRWLVDKDFIEAKMTEQINAAAKLVFSVPLKKRLPATYFFAAIPQPRGSGYLLFKIVTEQVQSDRVQYTCIEAAYDELKSYHYIKDDRPQDRTAVEMLQMALDGTRWSVGTAYDAGTGSTNFYYISSLEAIQKIADLFQLEVVFSISLDPNSHQIVRRLVNLYAQQGERTGKRFEYGSNLLSVEREESSENLITALIGRGKGEEKYHTADGKPAEEDQTPDGYGRRINFADVVWSTNNGNPVNKPAGQEYVEDPDATAAYGFDDGKPRIGIEIFEDITDPGELLQATWSALQTLKRPKVSFKANTLDVGDLGLGDTVAIIRHDIKIEYFTRVYKVEHNLLNEKQNTIELGDDFNSQSITSAINSIALAVKQTSQTANYASVSANGKNTNNYGKDRPSNAVEGDLWYKDLGNGEVDLYQYHDGNWILITSTRDLHNVQKQVEKQIDDLKKADEDGKKRDEEINQSIADTKKDLDTAKSENAAKSKSLEDDAADLRNRLGDASGRLNVVEKTVDESKQTIINAQGDISQLTKRADALELNYKDANGKLNQLNITVDGLKQTTTSQSGQINQFKVDLDGLKNSVSDNTSKISTLQVDLRGIRSTVSTKADVSYVDQKSNEWSVTVKGLDRKLEERTGVNPNMLNGTADWSGNWCEDQSNFDASTITSWVNDGWNDPEGNPALKSPSANLDRYPDKIVNLQKGTYTFSAWVYVSADYDSKVVVTMTPTFASGIKAKIEEKDRSPKVIPANKWIRAYQTFEVTSSGLVEVFFHWLLSSGVCHIGSAKLEKGDKATAWVPSANDPYKGTGETLSMINVDAGNILFKSKKIYLDADSTVFSGKAFIPDAAISNIAADKITTGTLNAGNINVINMNASAITTGTIQGTNLKINLNSGEILFQHGRITSVANTLNIDIDNGTMSVTNSNGAGVYFANGELALNDMPIKNPWLFTPKYGGIKRSTYYWSTGVWGMNLHSPNGVSLTTDNYNGAFEGGTLIDQTIDGSSMAVSSNGEGMINGSSVITISGGNTYDTEFGIKNRPHIWVGTQTIYGTGNRIIIDADYVHIQSTQRQTTSSGPNVFVASDGALVRSTSASKYKTMIERSHSLDYGERLLSLPTATWLDKAEERRFASGESKTKPVMHFGMIAEDLAAAGLEMLVSRGQDGELEGIQYDRIAPALLPVIKNLQDRIEKLEEQLNGTKSIVN